MENKNKQDNVSSLTQSMPALQCRWIDATSASVTAVFGVEGVALTDVVVSTSLASLSIRRWTWLRTLELIHQMSFSSFDEKDVKSATTVSLQILDEGHSLSMLKNACVEDFQDRPVSFRSHCTSHRFCARETIDVVIASQYVLSAPTNARTAYFGKSAFCVHSSSMLSLMKIVFWLFLNILVTFFWRLRLLGTLGGKGKKWIKKWKLLNLKPSNFILIAKSTQKHTYKHKITRFPKHGWVPTATINTIKVTKPTNCSSSWLLWTDKKKKPSCSFKKTKSNF